MDRSSQTSSSSEGLKARSCQRWCFVRTPLVPGIRWIPVDTSRLDTDSYERAEHSATASRISAFLSNFSAICTAEIAQCQVSTGRTGENSASWRLHPGGRNTPGWSLKTTSHARVRFTNQTLGTQESPLFARFETAGVRTSVNPKFRQLRDNSDFPQRKFATAGC